MTKRAGLLVVTRKCLDPLSPSASPDGVVNFFLLVGTLWALDAGLPTADAGAPTDDAGVPTVDAGLPVADAGARARQASGGDS